MHSNYSYWVVRYVPDTVRGEFVNVAVIVGKDNGDWAIQVAPDLRRASRLGGDAQILREWLNRLARSIRDYEAPPLDLFSSIDSPTVSSKWLKSVTARLNNAVRISEPIPLEAISAARGASFLFDHLVVTTRHVSRARTRLQLVNKLESVYRENLVLNNQRILRRPQASIGKQTGRFDFAVADGKIKQLSHVWAFDLKNVDNLSQEINAWNFVVGRLRDEGAQINSSSNAGSKMEVAPDVPISLVYQAPQGFGSRITNEHRDVFEAAMEAWQLLELDTIPSSQIDSVADLANIVTSIH